MADNNYVTGSSAGDSSTGSSTPGTPNSKGYKGNITSREAGNIVKKALQEQERIMAEASNNRIK